MKESDFFAIAGPISPQSDVALKPLSLPNYIPDPGPLHKVQFIIELVGRELIHHADAIRLLESKAVASMGNPEIFVMSPGRPRWQRLSALDDAQGYDSIAYAWDVISQTGNHLSSKSATELLRRASEVGFSLARKAVPLRPPQEFDALAQQWHEFREGFDVGVSAFLDPVVDGAGAKDVLTSAYHLGYRLQSDGTLEWRLGGWPNALLSVDPAGSNAIFDVTTHPSVPGVSVGFSLPRSPDPSGALERMFTTIDYLVTHVGGIARDEDGEHLDDARRKEMVEIVKGATATMSATGIAPGSPEALCLFGA